MKPEPRIVLAIYIMYGDSPGAQKELFTTYDVTAPHAFNQQQDQIRDSVGVAKEWASWHDGREH